MNHTCFFCQIRAFERLLERHQLNDEKKDQATREFMRYLGQIDWNQRAPQIAAYIQRLIRQSLDNPDPYAEVKRESNKAALELYPELKKIIDSSDNPWFTAMKIAIAGNIIDFGPGHDWNLMETVQQVLAADLKIDHSKELFDKIKQADNLLYLGDNAGEIVFDRLFLETIQHPNVTFAVRGHAVLNDATYDDTREVGIDKLAKIVDNGFDAPSTVLESCSTDFQQLFNNADLVIAKGMGNLEGLLNVKKEDLYFLFMVKCDIIGNLAGAKTGDFLVMKNPVIT